MTGKDLFAALNHVDDALVAEAETYAAHKVIPMRTVRWLGALAACVCLLVCWAVAVQWDPMSFLSGGAKNTAVEKSTATATTEGGYEDQAATEEAAVEEAEEEFVPEEEALDRETEASTGEAESASGGARPTESPENEEEAHLAYQMTDEYLIISGYNNGNPKTYADFMPENGTWKCQEDLRDRVAEQIRIQKTPTMIGGVDVDIRFLAAFRLYRDGKEINPDSTEYAAEIERLMELGYEFRTLSVENKDKSVRVQVCGLFTAEQLDQFDAKEFDASAEYGYVFYFPTNGDGTPLDWENEAALCGLPTEEDALVTKD